MQERKKPCKGMEKELEKIVFQVPETEEELEFYVVEETKFNGAHYLLVVEDLEEEEAYLLKDLSEESDTESVYVMVEDDKEREAVAGIFSELLEDIEIEAKQ